jgi:uncharacterized protein YbaP (TraB family)
LRLRRAGYSLLAPLFIRHPHPLPPILRAMRTQKLNPFVAALLLALAFLQPAAAQEKPAATPKTLHSLWKIQGKQCAVYLLGSIHALKAENYPLPAPIEAAFTNAQVAVFETDIAAMEDPSLAIKMMTKARLPEGQTLSTQLSPEVYQQFTNHLQGGLMSPAMMDQFTPGFAALTLTVLEMQKLGLDPEYGLDKHFFPLARKAGKQIVPLETVDFQLDLVTEFTKAEGNSLMKTTLKELANMKTELADLLKAWEIGDSSKLEKLLNDAMADEPVIFKRLLTDRNRTWLPKIEEFLQGDKNVIVIVGAGHLVGKEGVVELLRKKGIKVVQQ